MTGWELWLVSTVIVLAMVAVWLLLLRIEDNSMQEAACIVVILIMLTIFVGYRLYR